MDDAQGSTPAATGCGTVVSAMGLPFPGAVGLAAGFDRSGHLIADARDAGFGFVELGTVTPDPNAGADAGSLATTLAAGAWRTDPAALHPILGVNIGVRPGCSAGEAWRDYEAGVTSLGALGDYVALNFTSDAAAHLRVPSAQRHCRQALTAARDARDELAALTGRRTALLVKWPMEADADAARMLADTLIAHGFDGLVAAFHDGPDAPPWDAWVPPTCRRIAAAAPSLGIVAVGGIDRPERAVALRQAGVRLVQMHRGFTAGGPVLVRTIGEAMTS